jgi:hypothetical protein
MYCQHLDLLVCVLGKCLVVQSVVAWIVVTFSLLHTCFAWMCDTSSVTGIEYLDQTEREMTGTAPLPKDCKTIVSDTSVHVYFLSQHISLFINE